MWSRQTLPAFIFTVATLASMCPSSSELLWEPNKLLGRLGRGVVVRLGTWETQKIEVVLFLLKLVTSMGWWRSHISPPTSTTAANAPLCCTALAKETKAAEVCSWRNNMVWQVWEVISRPRWVPLQMGLYLSSKPWEINRSERGRGAAFLQNYIQVLKIVYSTAVNMGWLYVTIQQNGWFLLKL